MNAGQSMNWGMSADLVALWGMNVVAALIILIIGWLAAGWLGRLAGRALARTGRVDDTLKNFLASLVYYLIVAITLIAVLNRFGVETTSFIAVLGAAGLAIGLALQGTLGNIAAGVMLLVFRPFKVGDYIEGAALAGTVDRLTLFVTEMHTPDNVHMVVPNGQLWNTAIKNYSTNATRRVDLVFGIAYEDSIDRAFEVIQGVIGADARVHAEPEPLLAVGGLGDSAVDLYVRVWCDAPDYWALRFDLAKAVKEALDGAGISIPYPQRTVRVVEGKSAA